MSYPVLVTYSYQVPQLPAMWQLWNFLDHKSYKWLIPINAMSTHRPFSGKSNLTINLLPNDEILHILYSNLIIKFISSQKQWSLTNSNLVTNRFLTGSSALILLHSNTSPFRANPTKLFLGCLVTRPVYLACSRRPLLRALYTWLINQRLIQRNSLQNTHKPANTKQ